MKSKNVGSVNTTRLFSSEAMYIVVPVEKRIDVKEDYIELIPAPFAYAIVR